MMLSLPLSGDPFDFYRAPSCAGPDLLPGAAGWFRGFFDLREIVSAVGRYYLLPAVQVRDMKDATVVLSWEADPARLGVHFVTQSRAGLQPFYVSRLKTP